MKFTEEEIGRLREAFGRITKKDSDLEALQKRILTMYLGRCDGCHVIRWKIRVLPFL